MFWFFFLVVLVILWRVSRFRFGAVFIFSSLYIVSYYIGIPYYISVEDLDDEKSTVLISSASLFIVSFLLGAYLVEKSVNFDFIGRLVYRALISFPERLSKYKKLRICIVIFFGVLVGSYYFRYGIPYFSSSPDEARFRAVAGATPFFFLLTYLSPMYICLLVDSRGWILKSLTYMVVLAVSFFTAFKSAPAKLVIAYIMSKENYYSPKIVVKVVSFILLLIIFYVITMLKYSNMTGGEVWRNVLFRLFYVNIQNAVYVLEEFNYEEGFLWGGAFLMDLANYLPGGGDTFGVWVNKQLYGYENVSANPSFTVVWADIGWFLFIPMFLMGGVFQSIDKIMKKICTNRNEKIIWAFFVLTLGFCSTNPYAKNFYYTLPFVIYLFVTRRFILLRF